MSVLKPADQVRSIKPAKEMDSILEYQLFTSRFTNSV